VCPWHYNGTDLENAGLEAKFHQPDFLYIDPVLLCVRTGILVPSHCFSAFQAEHTKFNLMVAAN
jgi:hypothetical protein